MTMLRKWIIAAMLLAGNAAWAQDDDAGGYFGVGLGQLDYEEESFGLTLEDTTLAYKLYGGYRFDDTWAFEASYGQTSDLKWSDSGFVPGLGDASVTLSGDYEVLEIRGVAHLRAFMIGLGLWDADLNASLSGTTTSTGPFAASASDSDSGLSVILGGEWKMDTWNLRAEYEFFDTESTVDAYTLSLGLHFRF